MSNMVLTENLQTISELLERHYKINRFCAALLAGDVETIQNMLHGYLWDSISIRDTAVRRNMKEKFYHGMLLGLLYIMR